MKTWRACAAIGLGLSLAAFGCNGGSETKTDGGGGKRDAGVKRDVAIGADAGPPCVFDGTTYQPGESFTKDCVRFTCLGGNSVSSSGSPCTDGSADQRRDAGPDAATGSDARTDTATGSDARTDTADGPGVRDTAGLEVESRDTRPVEAGGLDTTPAVDTGLEDTAAPTPDLPAAADLPPVVQCTYLGQKYGPGVPFACECNTCKCDNTGTIVLVTNHDCSVDASP